MAKYNEFTKTHPKDVAAKFRDPGEIFDRFAQLIQHCDAEAVSVFEREWRTSAAAASRANTERAPP